MAGASLLTLIDDIATLLDDVAVMTKVAAKSTAGVLADDLALNAQQVSGVRAEREIPVVWAVAKGSFINKAILVPLALLISAFIPILITPLLMIGGLYLCFEGAEKIIHAITHRGDKKEHTEKDAMMDENLDLVSFEKDKIKGAIRTDFILSAEIIIIALKEFTDATITVQILALSSVAILMTVGVYGVVAGIVKLDDLGMYLHKKSSAVAQKIGTLLLGFAPLLMKSLSFIGLIAMFMVGGGILTHGLHALSEGIIHIAGGVSNIAIVSTILITVLQALFGLVCGTIAAFVVISLSKFKNKSAV
jgi:uncharacterized protein